MHLYRFRPGPRRRDVLSVVGVRQPVVRGEPIADTTDDDGGVWTNSRVTFTAADDGTWYVAAGGRGVNEGRCTLSVEEVADGL